MRTLSGSAPRQFALASMAYALLAAAVTMSSLASAQSSVVTLPAANQPAHVRGTLISADADRLLVRDRKGETVSLARTEKLPIAEVYPIDLADIKQGSFVGTTGIPQPDGTQEAIEVHVFPPGLRGTGEGHYTWDLQPGSTMTNASVAELAPAPASVEGGRRLRLRYAGGEQTVIVPPDVPIVEIARGDDTLLVPGAQVIVSVRQSNGASTATSVQAGRNGFTPPF